VRSSLRAKFMTKYRVFVTTQHPGDGVGTLSSQFQVDQNLDRAKPILPANELLKGIKGCDALVCALEDVISDEVMAASPDLKLIANVAVGYDNIDVEAATKRGILVTNTPGVLNETTADLAFALLMACARRVAEADRYVRDRLWKNWTPDLMLGVDIYGKTLGIVGYGRIGQAMGRRAQGFDMGILYTRRNTCKVDDPQCVDLDVLLARSDFISLHCPLTKETHHLIGERQFSLMRPEAILINTARGAVVDQAALIAALASRRIRGAGLDVFEDEPSVPSELIEMNNVVLAPHIGSATVETRSNMATLACSGVISAFDGELPANAVNRDVWPKFSANLNRQPHGA
jgi:glyoxylate reductase